MKSKHEVFPMWDFGCRTMAVESLGSGWVDMEKGCVMMGLIWSGAGV